MFKNVIPFLSKGRQDYKYTSFGNYQLKKKHKCNAKKINIQWVAFSN